MSSYIKFLQKELWSGQAVLSNLTLNCDLDLGPSHTVLADYTPSLIECITFYCLYTLSSVCLEIEFSARCGDAFFERYIFQNIAIDNDK